MRVLQTYLNELSETEAFIDSSKLNPTLIDHNGP